jgi:hypothetical protein
MSLVGLLPTMGFFLFAFVIKEVLLYEEYFEFRVSAFALRIAQTAVRYSEVKEAVRIEGSDSGGPSFVFRFEHEGKLRRCSISGFNCLRRLDEIAETIATKAGVELTRK